MLFRKMLTSPSFAYRAFCASSNAFAVSCWFFESYDINRNKLGLC